MFAVAAAITNSFSGGYYGNYYSVGGYYSFYNFDYDFYYGFYSSLRYGCVSASLRSPDSLLASSFLLRALSLVLALAWSYLSVSE